MFVFCCQCKTFKLKKTGSFYPFTLTDICGIEDKEGVQTDDIIKLLNGHIKDDYTVRVLYLIWTFNLRFKPCITVIVVLVYFKIVL